MEISKEAQQFADNILQKKLKYKNKTDSCIWYFNCDSLKYLLSRVYQKALNDIKENMEKIYKLIPFDLELAKKIQAGEIEGRIVTNKGGEARILAFDSKSYFIDSKIECCTTKDKGINKPLVVEYLDVNGDSQIYQVVNLLANGKLVAWGDSDCDLIIELPEETPKHEFKVGNKVRIKPNKTRDSFIRAGYGSVGTITEINNCEITVAIVSSFSIILSPEELELFDSTPKHKFKPFDKVLVRDHTEDGWQCDLFSHKISNGLYACVAHCWNYCIPYEGNEHLVGTTDNPMER